MLRNLIEEWKLQTYHKGYGFFCLIFFMNLYPLFSGEVFSSQNFFVAFMSCLVFDFFTSDVEEDTVFQTVLSLVIENIYVYTGLLIFFIGSLISPLTYPYILLITFLTLVFSDNVISLMLRLFAKKEKENTEEVMGIWISGPEITEERANYFIDLITNKKSHNLIYDEELVAVQELVASWWERWFPTLDEKEACRDEEGVLLLDTIIETDPDIYVCILMVQRLLGLDYDLEKGKWIVSKDNQEFL
jgi:hypothetical protein